MTVTDEGNGTLSFDADPDGTELVFTNREIGGASVNVSGGKELTGRALTDSDKWTFTITSPDGSPLPEETSVENSMGTFTFGDISFTPDDLDPEAEETVYTYIVTESGEVAGVLNDPEAVRTFTVTLSLSEDGQITAVTDPEDLGELLTFTNTYNTVSVQFSGRKTLSGKKLESAMFSFILSDGEGNPIQTVFNTASGKIVFKPIVYTEEGTYTYVVKEIAGGEPGVTYDSREYHITVTVSRDESGKLTAEVSGDDIHRLNFENEYHIEFCKITLPETGFPTVRTQVLPQQPSDINYRPLNWRIEIPSQSVSTDIVGIPSMDGYYPVAWLGYSAGLLEGSSLPGEGRSMIAGHNHLNDTEAGPFVLLKDLEIGERIFVTDPKDGLQIFEVYMNTKISEYGYSELWSIASMDEHSLTLITCEDERPDGGYENRRIVAAKPVR